MSLRVIQFSTGNVGRRSLRSIINRPGLELVRVHASSPDKVGRDAAELCGLDTPTGIAATDDLAALLALKADCAPPDTVPTLFLPGVLASIRGGPVRLLADRLGGGSSSSASATRPGPPPRPAPAR